MGVTYVEGTITGPTGRETTIEFLVDSKAKYTLPPLKNWKAIGLEPVRIRLGSKPISTIAAACAHAAGLNVS